MDAVTVISGDPPPKERLNRLSVQADYLDQNFCLLLCSDFSCSSRKSGDVMQRMTVYTGVVVDG